MSRVTPTTVPPATDAASRDDGIAVFTSLHRRLLGIAYRILRSRTEAEDIVQDTWVRWQRYDRAAVVSPTAFLVTTTTRLAINAALCARSRRETYVERHVPEPATTVADPALDVEHGETLEAGVRLLVELLPPTERAAFVLHEAFDYPYARIAEVLRTTEVSARQHATRARKHLLNGRPRAASRDDHRPLLSAVVAAARYGDVQGLEHVLLDEIHVTSLLGEPTATAVPPDGSRRGLRNEAAKVVRPSAPVTDRRPTRSSMTCRSPGNETRRDR